MKTMMRVVLVGVALFTVGCGQIENGAQYVNRKLIILDQKLPTDENLAKRRILENEMKTSEAEVERRNRRDQRSPAPLVETPKDQELNTILKSIN